jgi:predicted kinase
MSMMLVLVGIQGSGKSTFAKEFVSKNKSYIRTNRDDIRTMLAVPYNKSNEHLVVDIQLQVIERAYKNGYNIILDNTNFNPDVFKKIDIINRKYNAFVEFKFFDTPLQECLDRNSKREKPVPEDAIYKLYNKFVKGKTIDDIINNIQAKTPAFQIKHNPLIKINSNRRLNEFKNAIIVDIDGTISDANKRNIHDLSKVYSDTPRNEIIKIIKGYIDYYDDINVLVVTGRHSNSNEQTIEWLNTHFNIWGILYMRNEKDNRCDSIVKEEIYLDHIKNKYNILAVFDDRKRVVDMWRKYKLNTLQVNEGDF